MKNIIFSCCYDCDSFIHERCTNIYAIAKREMQDLHIIDFDLETGMCSFVSINDYSKPEYRRTFENQHRRTWSPKVQP